MTLEHKDEERKREMLERGDHKNAQADGLFLNTCWRATEPSPCQRITLAYTRRMRQNPDLWMILSLQKQRWWRHRLRSVCMIPRVLILLIGEKLIIRCGITELIANWGAIKIWVPIAYRIYSSGKCNLCFEKGFIDWKHAPRHMREHESSNGHRKAKHT